jgi:hypothetical protein
LDRVTKLIALSSSPFEGEARTAALYACTLIREHGLGVGVVSDQKEEKEPPPEPVPVVRIFSRYRGFCGICKSSYEKGARVAWAKAHGAVHPSCYRGRPWWSAA